MLQNQGLLVVNLKSSDLQVFSHHHDLVNLICVTNDQGYVPFVIITSSLMTCIQVCNKCNTAGSTSGAEAACPSRAPELTNVFFYWDSYCSISSFLSSFLLTFICLFVLFLLAIELSVLGITASGYPFIIFKLFYITETVINGY